MFETDALLDREGQFPHESLVGRRGLEPRTYGLKVRSSAIELATPGLVVIWTEIRSEIEPIAWARLSVWSAGCKGACLEAIKSRFQLQKVETPIYG